MAITHYEYESIHPFYDGIGRTGRIINILYLVQKNVLDLPVLYLGRYIMKHKNDYYLFLQKVRDTGKWEKWLLFILSGIEQTAKESIIPIASIKTPIQKYKLQLRSNYPKMNKQDLLNNFFKYPYTKREFIQNELEVSRSTAIRYLEALVTGGLLHKKKSGRDNFYLSK